MLSFFEHEKVFITSRPDQPRTQESNVTNGVKQFGYVSRRTKSGDQ